MKCHLFETKTYANGIRQKKATKITYHVWAFGRLLVQASIWWMVKSRGPAAPAKEANVGRITAGICISLPNLRI